MMNMPFFQPLIDFLLPPTCLLCMEKSENTKDICKACLADLPWLNNVCIQCALLISFYAPDNTRKCGHCLRYTPPYNQMIALWKYQDSIIPFISQLKYQHKLKYARLLGELLTEELIKRKQNENYSFPQLIIPIPLHYSRLRERGFNQSIEIAKYS
ncbi:MAG: hypothetical protein LEGION0398_MBIBDBAK_01265 [Legionellaceae bacterium]